jgi:hypothetical protein
MAPPAPSDMISGFSWEFAALQIGTPSSVHKTSPIASILWA